MTRKALVLATIMSTIIALPAFAKNPLVKQGTTAPAAVSDQDLDKIKGTGQYADLYGYYGLYYASMAVQNGAVGRYYGGVSNSNSTSKSYYSSASSNAYNSYIYFYYASYYANLGQ